MRAVRRFTPLLAFAIALGACGGASESEEPAATAEAGEESTTMSEEATVADACPPDSEIAGIVGAPVASRPAGATCFYESEDFETSVTIMPITASQADQLEGEMRDAAAPYGAELAPIDVGDRGSAWGSPAYGQGYAIEGEDGWLVEITDTSGGTGDTRAEIVRILERLAGGS